MGIKFDKISISGSINSSFSGIAASYWIATAGISSLGSNVDGLVEDSQGNFYVAGRINSYTTSLFKFDKDGQLLWARSVTGNSSYTTLIGGLEIDNENNVYLVQYERNSSFTLGIVHVVKVSSSGDRVWHRSIVPSSGLLTATKVAQRESDESILIVGEVSPGSQGGNDAFYAEVSTAGVISNTRSIGDSSSQLGHGIAVDSSGNTYIAGWGQWALNSQNYISKWAPDNSRLFSTRFDYTIIPDLRIYDLAVSSDAVYALGESSSSLMATISKFSTTGVHQWSRKLDTSNRIFYFSSSIDTDGSVYVSGYTTATTGSLPGIIVAKYLSDGTLSWQRVIEKSTTGTQSAGLHLTSNSLMISGSGSYGATLFRLPKDGTLTGVYDTYNYRESSFSHDTLAYNASGTITPTSVTRGIPTSTTALPFNTVAPTSGIITI